MFFNVFFNFQINVFNICSYERNWPLVWHLNYALCEYTYIFIMYGQWMLTKHILYKDDISFK